MARSVRAASLETRAKRLKLPVAKKPAFVKIGPRLGLGYRRNLTAGTWVVRVAGNWTKAIGVADDFEDADNRTTFDFWQAQERARSVARTACGETDSSKPPTVAQALDRYKDDIETRGGDIGNMTRVKAHVPESLAQKNVSLLTVRELREWRDNLAKHLAPASVNRTAAAFKAALNLAADDDERIASRQAWDLGLATIPDAEQSRNVILDESVLLALIANARDVSAEFGLLVELAAVTGARVSQLARLEVQDVQADRSDPRLMMPSSRKGRGQKKIQRRPVPVPTEFAARLRPAIENKAPHASLLTKPSGEPWKKADHSRLFQRVAASTGVDPAKVTIYALRHSNIVRQILAAVPLRVIAVNHDTSVAMLERTYSRYIGDHADELARRALLNTSAPQTNDIGRGSAS
jgi:integrase